jgi:hypothetical protein
MVQSYTDTDAQVRCIEDAINNVSPLETPLVKLIGINSLDNPKCFSTTYEWINDQHAPTSTTLGAAISSTTTTTCAVATSQGNYFRAGHIIRIGDELLRVSSVSSDTLTITRGHGSTTAATASNGATVDIVGFALVEGADAPDSFKMDVSTSYNYTQILQETVQVSRTQANLKQYGIKNEMTYQVAKKFEELAILMERSLFNSRRAAGSSSTARSFGGLTQYISTNTTDNSSAALTEKIVMDELQGIFDNVGQANKADLLVCNGWIKRKVTSFYAPYARMQRESRTGGVVVDVIDTEFGELDVMLNTWCPADELFLLNTEYLELGPMEGGAFFEEPLAKSGDYQKNQIVGEYTFKLANETAHAWIYSMSTSS